MSAPLSRDQRIVLSLCRPSSDSGLSSLIDKIAGDVTLRARAYALPTMILRHGVMLTLEYFDAKSNGEKSLSTLICTGIRAALPQWFDDGNNTGLSTTDISKLPLIQYIAVQDAAIVVATWIKRLVAARSSKANRNQFADADLRLEVPKT